MGWFARHDRASGSPDESRHGPVALPAVTAASFADEVIAASSDQPVAVDFWAPWCRPCIAMLPVLDALRQQYLGRISIVGVNTQEEPELTARLQVLSIPLIHIYSGGHHTGTLHGAQPKRKLIELFESALA